MRHGANRDKHDRPIRQRMEALGWAMVQVSSPGLPDYMAAKAGKLLLVEVKGEGEPFTAPQRETFAVLHRAGVPVYVLETLDDARALDAGTRRPWKPSDVGAVVSRGRGSRAAAPRKHTPGKSRAREWGKCCVVDHCVTSRLPGKEQCAKHAE